MPNRNGNALAVPFFLLLSLTLSAEIIKISTLKKDPAEWRVKRNVFSLIPVSQGVSQSRAKPAPEPVLEELKPPDPGEEVRQTVSYEGFLIRNGKKSGLVSAGGDFLTVSEGDMILERFKVVAVNPGKLVVEYQGQNYEILIKGESNGTGL